MRDSAEYSTIVRNEILTCPVPETYVSCTRLNVRSHVCMLSYTFPRPSLSFHTLNLTISIVGTPRRKKKNGKEEKRST